MKQKGFYLVRGPRERSIHAGRFMGKVPKGSGITPTVCSYSEGERLFASKGSLEKVGCPFCRRILSDANIDFSLPPSEQIYYLLKETEVAHPVIHASNSLVAELECSGFLQPLQKTLCQKNIRVITYLGTRKIRVRGIKILRGKYEDVTCQKCRKILKKKRWIEPKKKKVKARKGEKDGRTGAKAKSSKV